MSSNRLRRFPVFGLAALFTLALLPGVGEARAAGGKGKPVADPFAAFVWPPPPDKARIKLERVIGSRLDVEGESKLAKALIGASPKSPWDDFKKPFGVDIDDRGRILVTDWASGALVRVDLEAHTWDVLGVRGIVNLRQPLGLGIGPDGVIYVADAGRQQVLAFKPDGELAGAYGKPGELANPTDAAVSPDGKKLYVADSKAHKIVVLDLATGAVERSFGEPGDTPGKFAFPSGLHFAPDGRLFVVDQINCRVQIVSSAGEPLDQFGRLGSRPGEFVRPKDVAIDESGYAYVTDNAFNNFQLFDADQRLLTFVGQMGEGPGQFNGASGIAARGDRIAVVDQLGHRLQVFRFIAPKTSP